MSPPVLWHFWDLAKTNRAGESLDTCLQKYGYDVMDATDERDMIYKVVFLDETKSFGYAWLCWIYRPSTGDFGGVGSSTATRYEGDVLENTVH